MYPIHYTYTIGFIYQFFPDLPIILVKNKNAVNNKHIDKS